MIEITNVVEINTLEELNSLRQTNETVIVDFHAPAWCQPCKRLHPHFVKTAEQYDDVAFAQIDVDKAPWASKEFGFMSVPTVLKFTDNEVSEISGRTVIQLVAEIGIRA